jgi:hypothetical protein
MNLFIEPVTFEKSAAETTLSEDPNAWPHEALQELYKQVPYIADFSPHVSMDKVDGERGYGFGYIEVMNQTEAQTGEDPAAMQAAGIRQVRIPVVIKDGKLQPFDLLVTADSKVLPLTEARLRSAIFRPQAFDVTSRTPGDQSMIGQLYPPYRQNYGFGGGGIAMHAGMGKESSALEEYLSKEEKTASALDEYAAANVKHGRLGKVMYSGDACSGALDAFITKHAGVGSLLQAIAPTISATDQAAFADFVADQSVQSLLHKNAAAVTPAVQCILSVEPESKEKRASALLGLIAPTVVQVVRHDDGYRVKTASHLYWDPSIELVDRGAVIQRFGTKVALAADLNGAVTLAEGVDSTTAAEAPKATPVAEPGVYKVHTEAGKELIGTVIPNLLDVDGTVLPLALFTNGSQSAIQTDILGAPTETSGVTLPVSLPAGRGFFFHVAGDVAVATVPLTIRGSFGSTEGPVTYEAETFDGRPVQISAQPNLQTVAGVDGKMLVPEDWQWSSMGGEEGVALNSVEEPANMVEKAAQVEILSGGGAFSFRGPPVDKLAYDQREFLSLDAAMFLLAGLGVEQGHGAEKLAVAMAGRAPERVSCGREITLADQQKSAAVQRAEERLREFPSLRRNLWKEAAVVTDPMAVDTVLSLGFLTPDNLLTFIGYLPTIEESQHRMCDLLLAVRLGQSDIPQTALEKAVRSTEEVLEGLKALAFQAN